MATTTLHDHEPAEVDDVLHHSATGLSNEKIAMWAFLGSDCLLFGALISTYILYRGRSVVGPYPHGVYDIPYTSVSSFVLLMSSLTMVLALSAIQRNDQRRLRGQREMQDPQRHHEDDQNNPDNVVAINSRHGLILARREQKQHLLDTLDQTAKEHGTSRSVIAIASNSRLTITDYRIGEASREAKLSLGAGLLRAVVSTIKGPPHFEVDTATGVAAVRSTDWFVEAQLGSTQVGVLEGRVSLKSVATGKEIVIPAHWGARVEAGRDPVPARVWTGAEFDNFIRQPSIRFLQNNFPSPPLLLYSGRGSVGAEGDNCGACRGCRRP